MEPDRWLAPRGGLVFVNVLLLTAYVVLKATPLGGKRTRFTLSRGKVAYIMDGGSLGLYPVGDSTN
jgi:hypothetical protein